MEKLQSNDISIFVQLLQSVLVQLLSRLNFYFLTLLIKWLLCQIGFTRPSMWEICLLPNYLTKWFPFAKLCNIFQAKKKKVEKQSIPHENSRIFPWTLLKSGISIIVTTNLLHLEVIDIDTLQLRSVFYFSPSKVVMWDPPGKNDSCGKGFCR